MNAGHTPFSKLMGLRWPARTKSGTGVFMNNKTTSHASHPDAQRVPIDFISRSINTIERLRHPIFLLVASLIAFVVVIYFFSPRFVIWEGMGLGTPISYSNPEINRALFTLKKTESPFQFIMYPPPDQNIAANWRLFFPIIGHYLHIPKLIFYSLPHLGCLLVLALVAHIVCKHTGNRLLALCSATLMGTTSWFFVSTGWLAYFDSWYVLGLLLIGFSSSYWVVATACLIAPWIDERFIVTLPIAFAVRCIYFNQFSGQLWKSYWRDLLVIGGTIAPWFLFRLSIFFLGTDPYPVTQHYTTHNTLLNTNIWRMIESHWTGLRAIWMFVFFFLWYAFAPGKRWWTLMILGTILAAEIPLMAISGDWSRDMSTLMPAALLGVLLISKHKTAWLNNCVYLALAFNLFAPAVHGFCNWRLPISNLYTEIEHYKNPPDYLNPLAYTQLAIQLINKGDLTNALTTLNQALYLDSKQPDALFTRASLRQQMGDTAGSLDDFTTLMLVSPQYIRRQYEQSSITVSTNSFQTNRD